VGKILVVDDEQSMREFLGICLRRAGHEVTLAQSGGEAIALLRARPIDVVVSDLKMPGSPDGLGVLQAIKSGAVCRTELAGATPSPVDPEVILVTAFATTDTAVISFAAAGAAPERATPVTRMLRFFSSCTSIDAACCAGSGLETFCVVTSGSRGNDVKPSLTSSAEIGRGTVG